MTETVSGRLPDVLVASLDALGAEMGRTRSQILRMVVERGVAQVRLERALEAYRKREVSLGRATRMSGLHITQFLDALRQAGITFHYGVEDLKEDLEWAGFS